jgi:hypothetical protein
MWPAVAPWCAYEQKCRSFGARALLLPPRVRSSLRLERKQRTASTPCEAAKHKVDGELERTKVQLAGLETQVSTLEGAKMMFATRRRRVQVLQD